MCGRFTLTVTPEALAEQFHLDFVPALAPRFNIAPSQAVAIVRVQPENGLRFLEIVQWGLIPSWAEDATIGSRLINARAENLEEKPTFRASYKYRRCLVVSDGFYEWKGRGRDKHPYYIRMNDGEPFGFAGIWDHWEDPDGSVVESCAIITTEANELVRPIHERMPVIIPPVDYDLWLDPKQLGTEQLKPLLRPYPAEAMLAYPVSAIVNRAVHEDPQCIEPADKQDSFL
jgi:putative SOS response-associated peptidase YedK